MAVGVQGIGGRQLGKAALARANRIQDGDLSITDARVSPMAQDLGITFDANNNIIGNNTNDRLDALELASGTTGVQTVAGGSYTIASGIRVVLASSNASITLPTPSVGREAIVKKIDKTGKISINPNASETIDGETLIEIGYEYESFTMVSDGTNWFLI